MSLIGEPAGGLPRRADHRARPAVARRGVEQRPGARRAGHDGAAHDAVPRRGRAARRPDRDPARGPDHRERHARRAEAAPPARRRSSTSRSSRPSRRSSSRSSAETHAPPRSSDDHRTSSTTPPSCSAARCGTSRAAWTRSSRSTVMPIAIMVLFVYVFGGAIDTGSGAYVDYLLPGHPADHDRVRRLLHRGPAVHGHAERDLRAVPVDADRPVDRAVGARADLAGRQLISRLR